MNESTEVSRRLVVGRKRDGRCEYDPTAKQELVRQCKQPGVSVSRVAMQHGVNANLLRAWIKKSLLSEANNVQLPNHTKQSDARPAFIAVQIEPGATPALKTKFERSASMPRNEPAPTPLRMHVRLPNGVALDIDTAQADELLCAEAIKQEVHFLWRPQLRYPKGQMVLEAAVNASAEFLVTHNLRAFAACSRFALQVVTPNWLPSALAPKSLRLRWHWCWM